MRWIDLIMWTVPLYLIYYGLMISYDLFKSKKVQSNANHLDVYDMESDVEETTDVTSLFSDDAETDSLLSIDSNISEIDVKSETIVSDINEGFDNDISIDIESINYQSIPVQEYIKNAKKLAASVSF